MTFAVNIAQGGSNNTTMRNRIINGAMVIDQRNAGAAVTLNGGTNVFAVDRFASFASVGTVTAQQSSTAPAGFINSTIYTVTASATVGSADRVSIAQNIEGLNIADLGWGTANAQTVTLSFWVRSSLTGTFGGALRNSANDRSYPFTYTINAANTFEQKTITVVGDTSGTWLTTNGVGIRLFFGLGVGSTQSGTSGAWASALYTSATGATSVVGTSGATFYITGVQLEAGTTASPFEYRLYGTELSLCYRYFYKNAAGDTLYGVPCAYNGTVSNTWLLYWLPVTMRSIPTIVSATWSGGAPSATYPTPKNIAFNFAAGNYYMDTSTTMTASAEL